MASISGSSVHKLCLVDGANVHVSPAWIWPDKYIWFSHLDCGWMQLLTDYTSGTLYAWEQLCLWASVLLKASFSETLNHLCRPDSFPDVWPHNGGRAENQNLARRDERSEKAFLLLSLLQDATPVKSDVMKSVSPFPMLWPLKNNRIKTHFKAPWLQMDCWSVVGGCQGNVSEDAVRYF